MPVDAPPIFHLAAFRVEVPVSVLQEEIRARRAPHDLLTNLKGKVYGRRGTFGNLGVTGSHMTP